MTDSLPIYRVEPEDASRDRLAKLGEQIFGLQQYAFGETPDAITLRDGRHVVELAHASGAVWAADESQLWNPSIKATLPTDAVAAKTAMTFLKRNGLLPKLGGPFAYAKPILAGTQFALMRGGKRQDRKLDVSVTYPMTVDRLPVVGGGSDLKVTLGSKGQVIAYNGGWRPATDRFDAKLVDPAKAKEQFHAVMDGVKVTSASVSLAYYAAPSFTEQQFLYPVYVCSGTAVFGKQKVPLRQVMLPATDFGPAFHFPEPQPQRPKGAKPTTVLTEGVKGKLANGRSNGNRRSPATRAATRPWEAGTSWIGQSGGLSGSKKNAQGFVDEWAAAGWHIDFNWGDANAWESDWRRNDDQWVDNADFVFYTGHASMNGWVLSKPDDGGLDFTEVGNAPQTPGDLWGQSDLEWATIAACGPLQDNILSPGGGDVLSRWDGAFDGMHILMGYGAVTLDNEDEGRKLAQYAKGGSTLINSWFRTAREIQPATTDAKAPDGPVVWVGAMWVGKNGADPFNDHAWDYGSVSADPTSPSFLAAMWTTC
jgi:hypothetical protein